jgi:predicted component of type VI protein secretion system
VEPLGVVINAIVMAGVGLALWWVFRGRFEALERRIDRLEEGIEKRLDQFEARMDRFETILDSFRSDLTAVALAVGARPQARGR